MTIKANKPGNFQMSCANITQFTWRTITGIHPPRMLKVDLDNFETQKTHVYQ